MLQKKLSYTCPGNYAGERLSFTNPAITKKIIVGIFFLVILTLLEGCFAKLDDNEKLDISIELLKSNAWINLMPGINMQPTFHFAGELKIKNNSGETVRELKLQEINFYFDSTLVYKFVPVFKKKMDDSSNNISSSGEEIFAFSSPKGLKLKSELNSQKLFNAVLRFSSGGKIFEFKIDNIKVEKVY